MQRRNFIKKSCVACMGLASTAILLKSCATSLPMVKATPQNQSLSVSLDKFSGNNNLVILRCSSLENDILLVKNNNDYKALYLKCTHEGVGLTATDKKIICSAHGSTFDFQGNVMKEPALRPLHQFQTEVTNDNIIIHLI